MYCIMCRVLPEEVLRQDDLLLEIKKRTRIDTHTHTHLQKSDSVIASLSISSYS